MNVILIIDQLHTAPQRVLDFRPGLVNADKTPHMHYRCGPIGHVKGLLYLSKDMNFTLSTLHGSVVSLPTGISLICQP